MTSVLSFSFRCLFYYKGGMSKDDGERTEMSRTKKKQENEKEKKGKKKK